MAPLKLDQQTELFERSRSRLRGVAYRMLGSVADADDAVQDVYLKWQKTALDTIDYPEAWLVTTCTRRCIDMLRAAHRSRVDYVGAWLPEPVLDNAAFGAGEQAELASSLTMAFLLLLERLGPLERAAYLLHEVFGYTYKDVAFTLDRNVAACRQIVSRANKRLKDKQVVDPPPPERHEALVVEFMDALRSGDTAHLTRLLADDVEFIADGGGKVPAVEKTIVNLEAVAPILAELWTAFWCRYAFEPVTVNGNAGAILRENGAVSSVLSLTVDQDGKFLKIHVVRNPNKLRHIDVV